MGCGPCGIGHDGQRLTGERSDFELLCSDFWFVLPASDVICFFPFEFVSMAFPFCFFLSFSFSFPRPWFLSPQDPLGGKTYVVAGFIPIRGLPTDSPRLLWVAGPNEWSTPLDRGGGQDQAVATYQRGLEAARAQKGGTTAPLEPSWGEPELLASLAWSNLHGDRPDLNAADQYAQAAPKLVPYWHYVRDILMPQIRAAQAKAAEE